MKPENETSDFKMTPLTQENWERAYGDSAIMKSFQTGTESDYVSLT
jgi:hypothetical protein